MIRDFAFDALIPENGNVSVHLDEYFRVLIVLFVKNIEKVNLLGLFDLSKKIKSEFNFFKKISKKKKRIKRQISFRIYQSSSNYRDLNHHVPNHHHNYLPCH